jgi:hypothetical protein
METNVVLETGRDGSGKPTPLIHGNHGVACNDSSVPLRLAGQPAKILLSFLLLSSCSKS